MINIIANNGQKLHESQRFLGERFEKLVTGKTMTKLANIAKWGVKSTKNTVLKSFNYLTISEQSVEFQIVKINEI